MNKSNLPVPHKPYEVGYGKPPKETQFQKGRSGNPLGRPKGAKNKRKRGLADQVENMLLKEAYREVRINDEGGPITIPMMEAIIRSMAVKAAKGDHRSQKFFFGTVQKIEAEKEELRVALMEKFLVYKLDAEREIERRKRIGADCSDIIPHPDDIGFDPETFMPTLLGPAIPSEKKSFEKTYAVICNLKDKLEIVEEALESEIDEEEREELEELKNIAISKIRNLDKQIFGWRPKD